MQTDKAPSEWQSSEHALSYLARQDKLPHRTEGEKVLLSQIPQDAKRVLDLGTGDGRLLALIKLDHPHIEGVALDFSEPMIEQAKKRFGNDKQVTFFTHDLALPLPTTQLGTFDTVTSSLAIHHLEHPRKEQLYTEIYRLLNPKGVFCNLEHVSSATENLHQKFLAEINMKPQNEDPSNKLLDCETQLGWLRKIGYTDVDCYWKWFEVALLVGFKPA
jgi:tRNA (cmo5U34)-methyltransferase